MKLLRKRSPFFDKGDYLTGPRDWQVLNGLRNILAVLGAAIFLILATPVDIALANLMARPWQYGTTGTLVVFAGAGTPDPVGGPAYLDDTSYWRSVYAVRSWRAGKYSRLHVFQGALTSEMATYLRAASIPPAQVQTHPATSTLAESARVLAAQPDLAKPVVLLTSDFHIPRAKRALQAVGLTPIIDPFPDAIKRGQPQSWYKRLTVFTILVAETWDAILGR